MAALFVTLVGTAPIAAQSMPAGYLKEMPDPARVISSFDGDKSPDKTLRQYGALYQLKTMLEDLSDGRVYRNQLTPEEQRIRAGYVAAMARFEAPHFDDAETRRLGRNSPSAKWFDLRTHYELDKTFRNELLDRFFSPAWKTSFLAVEARMDSARQASLRQEPVKPRIPAAPTPSRAQTSAELGSFIQDFIVIFTLTLFGLAILTLVVTFRYESGPSWGVDNREALQLPEPIRRIQVFRKDYEACCRSGKLYNKDIWTETSVSTRTSGGGVHEAGGTVYTTPSTTTTSVSSIAFNRLWLRSLDLVEFSRTFPVNVLSATQGHVISTIDSNRTIVMAYNHSTGQFATSTGWVTGLHKPNKLPLRGWSVPCAALAGYLVLSSLHRNAFTSIAQSIVVEIVWILAIWFIWAIPATILNAIVTAARNRRFEKRVVPDFRRFLRESTPELLARFRDVPK